MRPDCNGYPSDYEVEYTDEEFNYDQTKLDLALECDPCLSKDSIRIKDSFKLLEIHALQKLHEESLL